jgi:hypothetical protein
VLLSDGIATMTSDSDAHTNRIDEPYIQSIISLYMTKTDVDTVKSGRGRNDAVDVCYVLLRGIWLVGMLPHPLLSHV